MDMYFEEKQKEKKSSNKHVNMILVQHNNPYAVMLERQIFAEAIEKGRLNYIQETKYNSFRRFWSRRKIQRLLGRALDSWIIQGTDLEMYLKKKYKKNETTIVLFINSVFTEIRYPVSALKYLKKKYNAYFVLYYLDTVSRGVSTYANYLRENNVFDLVYTFDKNDAEKYGIIFWQTPYSKMDLDLSDDKDLYFCGVDTDRVEIIKDISNHKDINFKMDLIRVNENNTYKDNRIKEHEIKDIMPYMCVLKSTLQANCILEIVRPNQVGFTLRAFEAVVYNKKLLTNNPHVTNFDFYNSKYMKVFTCADDIDWEWVCERTNVDYKYNGSFSPIKFIGEIENKLCRK